MKNIKHFKNTHFSWPPKFKCTNKVNILLTVHESMAYDLGDEDQLDWNKLIGLKVHYFRPMETSMMWAWRWSVEKQCVQFMPYQHIEGERVFYDTDMVEAKIGDMVNLRIVFDKEDNFWDLGCSLWTFNEDYPVYMSDREPPKRCYQINPWFGGNRRAPHKIILPIKFMK